MRIFSEDVMKLKDKLYIFARDINFFYSIDLIDGKITFIDKLPEEQFLSERLVSKVLYWKEQLYFIPLKAKKLWIYSLINKNWEKIEIENCTDSLEKSYFWNAVIYKDILYMFGGYYSAIVKVEMNTKNISYIKDPFIKKNIKRLEDYYFRGNTVQVENRLYLASCIDNTVLVFNMEDNSYQWIKVGREENRYSGIIKKGKNFWLSPRHNSPIVKWNGKDKFTEYKLNQNQVLKYTYYSGIVKKEDSFIIYTMSNDSSSIVMTKNEEIFLEENKYTFYKEINGEYIYQCSDGRIHYIDRNGQSRIYENEIESNLRDLLLKEIDKNIVRKQLTSICYEGKPFLCNTWLSILFK